MRACEVTGIDLAQVVDGQLGGVKVHIDGAHTVQPPHPNRDLWF